jgi:hypothetical protein
MKSIKNTLIFALTVLALGAVAFAWKEYQELSELRASAVDPAERASLQKRVWDTEKRVQELQREIASGHPAAGAGGAANAGPNPVQGGGALVSNVLDRMNDPEVQKLMAEQIRAQIERRYAKLFAQLNLPPDKLEQFKTLLVDRQQSAMDVLTSANEQGISDPRDFQKLVESTQADVDGQIKATLGEADYAQYQGFQQSQAARGVANQLQDSLRNSSAPLSSAQSEQLTQVMTQNRATAAAANLNGNNPPALITDDTITQSQAFLSAPQVQALQQLQQQQQSQRRLQQLMLQGPGGGAGAPAASAPAGP